MGLNGFIQKRVNQKCFVKPCPRIFHGYYFVYSWSGTAIIVICPFGGNNDVDEGVEKGGSAQFCILYFLVRTSL